MAKDYSRTQRIGDQMQRELAVLIQREIKDPRLGLVTITAVDVSRDLSHAKVFITVMGKDDDAEQIKLNLEILGEAAGYLRMLLGKSMKVRTIPQLHFHYDASIRRGAELSPEQWEDPQARALMVRLDGRAPDTGLRTPASNTTLVILFNASSGPVSFTLPDDANVRWRVLADTAAPDSEAVFEGGHTLERCDRSLLLLGVAY